MGFPVDEELELNEDDEVVLTCFKKTLKQAPGSGSTKPAPKAPPAEQKEEQKEEVAEEKPKRQRKAPAKEGEDSPPAAKKGHWGRGRGRRGSEQHDTDPTFGSRYVSGRIANVSHT